MTVPADRGGAPNEHVSPAWLFGSACLGMFTFGMVIALLGTLFGLPETRLRLGIDLAGQGDLFGALSFAMLVSSLVAGPTLDRAGGKPVLVGGAAVVTAGLLSLAASRSYAAGLASALLLGFGSGWLNVATNALVSEVHAEQRGRMLNLLGVFFGVGALFVPVVVALGFTRLSLVGTVLLCAAVAAAAAVAPARLRFPPPSEPASFQLRDMRASTRRPGVLLFAALLFCQSGNEASLSGWTSTYVGSVGWSPLVATQILVGYWVMAIVGRAASARLQSWLGNERLVLGAAVVSAAGCLTLLLAGRSLPALIAGALVTSLALAGIFQTTLAIAGDRYQRFAGTVFGFLFSSSSVGAMAFPWGVGHLSQAAGARLGMLVPLAGTLLVCACAAAVLRGRAGTSRNFE